MNQDPYELLVEAITQLQHHCESIGLEPVVTLDVSKSNFDAIVPYLGENYDRDYVTIARQFKIGRNLIREKRS